MIAAEPTFGGVVTLSQAVSVGCAVVIPFFVDLVTKSHASPRLKSGIAAFCSVLAGVLPTIVWPPSGGWTAYVVNVFIALAVAMGVHQTGASDGVQARTARVGVGSPRSTGRSDLPQGDRDIAA